MTFVKNILRYVLAWLKLLKRERNASLGVGLANRIYSLSKGFLSDNYIVYNLSKNNSADYISDYVRMEKLPSLNNYRSVILDDKMLFFHYLKNTAPIVPIEAVIKNGKIYDTENNLLNTTEFIETTSNIVLKPVDGGGGSGIIIIEKIEGVYYINKKQADVTTIAAQISKLKNYIVNRRVVQTGWAAQVNPDSLNTIRILTLFSKKENKAKILIAVHRFGTKKSVNVDNWSGGGINFNIDIESGVLSKGASYPKGNSMEWHINHPDTGVQVEGMKVQNWEEIKEGILKLSNTHSFIPYIGWDVIPMENSYLILEANSNSDVNLLQIHKGLLQSAENRELFKSYNVV